MYVQAWVGGYANDSQDLHSGFSHVHVLGEDVVLFLIHVVK